MPTWKTELPPEHTNMGFCLKRTPASAPIHAIITSPDLLICDTHYWHGRTTPCERIQTADSATLDDSPCQACREKTPWRTHVYCSCYDVKHQDHFLFECTAHAARPLQEYRQANSSLRGCILFATRPKGGPNSQVIIETGTANLTKLFLPEPPNLMLALSVIWRLPLKGLVIEDRRHHSPELRTRAAALDAMRSQPDNLPDPPTVAEIIAGNGELRQKVSA